MAGASGHLAHTRQVCLGLLKEFATFVEDSDLQILSHPPTWDQTRDAKSNQY